MSAEAEIDGWVEVQAGRVRVVRLDQIGSAPHCEWRAIDTASGAEVRTLDGRLFNTLIFQRKRDGKVFEWATIGQGRVALHEAGGAFSGPSRVVLRER